jgi:hypothetical protein
LQLLQTDKLFPDFFIPFGPLAPPVYIADKPFIHFELEILNKIENFFNLPFRQAADIIPKPLF